MTPRLEPPAPESASVWRTPRIWCIAASIFLVFGLINASGTYVRILLRGDTTYTFGLALAGNLPFWLSSFLALPVVVWAVHRVPLEGPRWIRVILFHVAVSIPHSVARLLLGALIAHPLVTTLGEPMSLAEGFQEVLLGSMTGALTMYWAQVGVVHAVDFYVASRERERRAARAEVRAAQLQTSLERAQLDWLRSQLNPHFLFNTLNSVCTLARQRRTDAVVDTLVGLSDLLRATLSHSDSMVRLDREIELLEKYLAIERVRFGERLTVRFDVDADAPRVLVPSLLLQPIVENALKHGLNGVMRPVSITVRALVDARTVRLEVRDSGRGFDPDWQEGVGLANTRARLAQIYDGEATLDLVSLDPGACVRITLPRELAPAQERASPAQGPLIAGATP